MYALFIVLNETSYLDQILEQFVEVGVKGATVLDSQGMAGAIVHGQRSGIPLFGSLKTFMDGARPYNKTIFTVIEDEEILEKAINVVKGILGDMEKPGVGLMFTLPIGNIYGIRD